MSDDVQKQEAFEPEIEKYLEIVKRNGRALVSGCLDAQGRNDLDHAKEWLRTRDEQFPERGINARLQDTISTAAQLGEEDRRKNARN